jgi:hypothetical protein
MFGLLFRALRLRETMAPFSLHPFEFVLGDLVWNMGIGDLVGEGTGRAFMNVAPMSGKVDNPIEQGCQGSGEPRALSAAATASGCWVLRLSFY